MMILGEKRGVYIESTGCYECIFYSSYCPCQLKDGPIWEKVYLAWRNGGFAEGCPLNEIKKCPIQCSGCIKLPCTGCGVYTPKD